MSATLHLPTLHESRGQAGVALVEHPPHWVARHGRSGQCSNESFDVREPDGVTPASCCGTRFHTFLVVPLSSRHVGKPLASSGPACLSPLSPPISVVALLLLALAAHPPDRPPAEPRRPATPHTPSRARHRKPRVTQLSLPTRSHARCELRGRGRGVAAPPSKPRTVPLLYHTLQCSRAPDAHTPRMP